MNPEEIKFLEEQENELALAKARNQNLELDQYQRINQQQIEEGGIVKEQLELEEHLKLIRHLLKGDVQAFNENNELVWKPSEDRRMQVLSPYGVDFCMRFLQMYMNKNTLLTNYDEDTILQKMEDIGYALNDYCFIHSEAIFELPSIEDCKAVLMDRIDKKVKAKLFDLELMGIEANEEEVKQIFVNEIKDKVEREIQIIRDQLKKDKLKSFEVLIRVMVDAIHSTYQRSWKGEERTSLRRHMTVSETKGGSVVQQPQASLNPLSWLSRR